ncbi:peptidoglycan-binding protein, partial [Streptomyces hyaluromycini]
LVTACAIVVAGVVGAAATGVLGGGGTKAAAAAPSGPPATTTVKRTTLTSTQTVDGTLGYGDTATVQAPASGASGSAASSGTGQSAQSGGSGGTGSGIVTWMPSDGDVISRGDPVYKVDQQSVPLLYGSVPLYRTLKDGSTGSDVKMLEQNLHALGYRGFTVDSDYDANTAAAVEKWQKKLGRSQTGEVEVGDAAVASGARRVAHAQLALGSALGGTVLTWTGTERVISVNLDVQYENLARKGATAVVTLPDDTEVQAEVTKIGTPTTSGGSSSSGSSGSSSSSGSSDAADSSSATVPVELTIKDPKKLGNYQVASVTVEFASETRPNVLAVPVNALFAEPDGGYAVEVVSGGTTAYKPVRLGMFGNGMVEVSGAGIDAGTVVGVPK